MLFTSKLENSGGIRSCCITASLGGEGGLRPSSSWSGATAGRPPVECWSPGTTSSPLAEESTCSVAESSEDKVMMGSGDVGGAAVLGNPVPVGVTRAVGRWPWELLVSPRWLVVDDEDTIAFFSFSIIELGRLSISCAQFPIYSD